MNERKALASLYVHGVIPEQMVAAWYTSNKVDVCGLKEELAHYLQKDRQGEMCFLGSMLFLVMGLVTLLVMVMYILYQTIEGSSGVYWIVVIPLSVVALVLFYNFQRFSRRATEDMAETPMSWYDLAEELENLFTHLDDPRFSTEFEDLSNELLRGLLPETVGIKLHGLANSVIEAQRKGNPWKERKYRFRKVHESAQRFGLTTKTAKDFFPEE